MKFITRLYENVFTKNIFELLLVIIFSYISGLLFWQVTHIGGTLGDFISSNNVPLSSNIFLSIKYIELYFIVFGIAGFWIKNKIGRAFFSKQLLIAIVMGIVAVNATSIVEHFSLLHTSIFGVSAYTFFSGDNTWFWQDLILAGTFSYFLTRYFIEPLQKRFSIKLKNYFVFVLIGIAMIAYIILACVRHWRFDSGAMDLGGYDQAVWGFSQLKFLPSTIYEWGNLLGDHFEPILLLLSPLYWINKGPYTLLVFQSIWVCIGAYPIYLLSRKIIGSKFVALCLSFSYLFFIGIVDALWYDFHPLTLTPTFIAFILWFMQVKKTGWYWIAIFGLLLCKETTSIYVVFIGLYVFFIKKDRATGLLTILAGLFWYIFAIKIMMGVVFGNNYKYMEAYAALGNNPVEIIKTLLTNPFYAFKTLFTPELKVNTWLGLFGSFGFLPLLSPASLLMAIPMLGEKFLGSKVNFYIMFHHYAASIAPILVYATVNGIANIKNKFKTNIDLVRWSGVAIVICVLMTTFFYYTKIQFQSKLLNNLWDKNFYTLEPYKKDLYTAINMIPHDASVLTQNALVPHVSDRKLIYDFYPTPELKGTDYILISPAIGYPEVPHSLMDQFLHDLMYNNPMYHIVYANNNVYLFQINNK